GRRGGRHSRNGIPVARVARADEDSGRGDARLLRACRFTWTADSDASGRARVRDKSHRSRRALSPGGRARRRRDRLSLGHRRPARAAVARVAGRPTMTPAAERDYVLGTHDAEIARLGLQHRVWRPRVLDAWRRAGLTSGWTAVDVGCGPGYASLD